MLGACTACTDALLRVKQVWKKKRKKKGLQGWRAQTDAINWVSARVSDIKEALEARVREYTR